MSLSVSGKSGEGRAYIAIDMKSFYASVECVARGLNPLRTHLLVADGSRSDQTICLAVSPSLKAIGVPSRPRLFEAKQAIAAWESRSGVPVHYIMATPRMRLYEEVSARIFSIVLQYAAPEDVHVYSIDESFIDCTPYLHFYRAQAQREGVHPARLMAMTIIKDVLRATGITATVGIGTNLYLAKVAMDIVAKKKPPDENGVRIAELNEASYCYLLWSHRPLTDFWMLGPGKARTLQGACLFTMGDIAAMSQWNEEWFYRKFGIDAEILIDHAFGLEPVTLRDIKGYRADAHSLSSGQVLPRPYHYPEARNVFREMAESLCGDLFARHLKAAVFSWWVSYDHLSLEEVPNYQGPVVLDFYGRLHPKHHNGTVRLSSSTNQLSAVAPGLLLSFDQKTDHRLLFRRLNVAACDVASAGDGSQLDIWTEPALLDREFHLQKAMQSVRSRYGANAVFRANSLLEGATLLERNGQIGGHRA